MKAGTATRRGVCDKVESENRYKKVCVVGRERARAIVSTMKSVAKGVRAVESCTAESRCAVKRACAAEDLCCSERGCDVKRERLLNRGHLLRRERVLREEDADQKRRWIMERKCMP
jgi:hypothetical protein